MPRRATKKLTAAAVERLKAPATGRAEHFDASLPGFALRITANGHKSFVVFYRLAGRQRRYTIGTYHPKILTLADARAKASDVLDGLQSHSQARPRDETRVH